MPLVRVQIYVYVARNRVSLDKGLPYGTPAMAAMAPASTQPKTPSQAEAHAPSPILIPSLTQKAARFIYYGLKRWSKRDGGNAEREATIARNGSHRLKKM